MFDLGYVTCILDDARVFASHAKKKVIDLDDVKLAVQMTIDRAFTTPPPRDVSFCLLLIYLLYNSVLNILELTVVFSTVMLARSC